MIFFSHKFGQLGNRLFAFAHLIANAAANNYTVVNLSFDEYAKYFQATSHDSFCRFPPEIGYWKSNRLRSVLFFLNRGILKLLRKTKFFRSPAHTIIIADLPDYQFGDNKYYELESCAFQDVTRQRPIVFLFGRFFRDYRNFEKYQDTVRLFFAPTAEIQKHVDELINSARKGSDLVVGVHIRRGDYAQFAHGRYFYSQDKYAQKIDTLQRELAPKRITYIICSNERVSPDTFDKVNFIIGSGHPVEDMYALSQCDLILGPPSTFSSWAAFYGNKPLCQMRDANKAVTFEDFVILPPETLYNF